MRALYTAATCTVHPQERQLLGLYASEAQEVASRTAQSIQVSDGQWQQLPTVPIRGPRQVRQPDVSDFDHAELPLRSATNCGSGDVGRNRCDVGAEAGTKEKPARARGGGIQQLAYLYRVMDYQAAVRSLVREGCRLLDAADGQTAAAVIDAVHAALVMGVGESCTVYGRFAQPQSTGADAAGWRSLQASLERLEQRQTTEDTDSIRACFFWGAFEPWAASLLTGVYRVRWARRGWAR